MVANRDSARRLWYHPHDQRQHLAGSKNQRRQKLGTSDARLVSHSCSAHCFQYVPPGQQQPLAGSQTKVN